MGQTLTNGIFLPNEGERNCYTGLESNWRAIDAYIGNYNVHVADVVIHVSQEDRNKWDAVTGKADSSALTAHTGNTTIHVTAADKTKWDAVTSKADASALTAHTGDTTIHVTAADKSKWDAVTSKANDTDVVHKSGAETIAGLKTFTDLMSIDGDYLGTESSTNQRTNLQLRSNRDTAGKSGALITRFRQNRTQGGLLTGDLQMLGFDFLENEVRTNILSLQATGWADNVPTKVNIISGVNEYSFGNTARPCMINGINPGALSLPDLTAGVDISGYFTTGTTENTYTPTVNGWVCIHAVSSITAGIYVENSKGFYASSNSMVAYTGSDRYVNLCFPVIGGESYNIVLKSVNTSIAAKFFPCMGNV